MLASTGRQFDCRAATRRSAQRIPRKTQGGGNASRSGRLSPDGWTIAEGKASCTQRRCRIPVATSKNGHADALNASRVIVFATAATEVVKPFDASRRRQ